MARYDLGGEGAVLNPPSAPTNGAEQVISVVDNIVYYYDGGHRYKLTATLDDPIITGGLQFIGGADILFINGSTLETVM